ncbi:hypothetical protein V8E52_000825 [Russula decolorans]
MEKIGATNRRGLRGDAIPPRNMKRPKSTLNVTVYNGNTTGDRANSSTKTIGKPGLMPLPPSPPQITAPPLTTDCSPPSMHPQHWTALDGYDFDSHHIGRIDITEKDSLPNLRLWHGFNGPQRACLSGVGLEAQRLRSNETLKGLASDPEALTAQSVIHTSCSTLPDLSSTAETKTCPGCQQTIMNKNGGVVIAFGPSFGPVVS